MLLQVIKVVNNIRNNRLNILFTEKIKKKSKNVHRRHLIVHVTINLQ